VVLERMCEQIILSGRQRSGFQVRDRMQKESELINGHPGKRNCNRPNQRWNQVSDSERVQRVGRFVVAEHIIIAGRHNVHCMFASSGQSTRDLSPRNHNSPRSLEAHLAPPAIAARPASSTSCNGSTHSHGRLPQQLE